MISKEKKIVFVIHDVTQKGGEERMCSIIANYLQSHSYNVSVISLWSRNGGSTFFHFNRQINIIYPLGGFVQKRIEKYIPQLKYLKRKLRKQIIDANADIVIDVDTRITPLTSDVLQGTGIKHVAWDHFCYDHFSQVYPHVLPFLQNCVDKLVVLTKDDYRDYFYKAQIPASKLVQIYNPSPIELTDYTYHQKKKILAMGRLEEQKGFDRLLNIWARIERLGTDWQLEIVGSGYLETQLKDQAKQLKLRDVIFTPATRDPLEKFKESSIFVFTSRFEGFGLVVVEALNASVPVIAFNCNNGPREIVVDGHNGYLITDDDEEKFTSCLYNLMNDSSKRKELSQNCLSSVSKFKLDNIGKCWEKLIEELLL